MKKISFFKPTKKDNFWLQEETDIPQMENSQDSEI